MVMKYLNANAKHFLVILVNTNALTMYSIEVVCLVVG